MSGPTPEAFFAGHPEAWRIYRRLEAMVRGLGEAEVRVGKSQIAFVRRTAFAWAWRPGAYLSGKTAPLVLSVGLRRRDPSTRWKEVVEPRPGRFTHHLELTGPGELDGEVQGWLREAWDAAK